MPVLPKFPSSKYEMQFSSKILNTKIIISGNTNIISLGKIPLLLFCLLTHSMSWVAYWNNKMYNISFLFFWTKPINALYLLKKRKLQYGVAFAVSRNLTAGQICHPPEFWKRIWERHFVHVEVIFKRKKKNNDSSKGKLIQFLLVHSL